MGKLVLMWPPVTLWLTEQEQYGNKLCRIHHHQLRKGQKLQLRRTPTASMRPSREDGDQDSMAWLKWRSVLRFDSTVNTCQLATEY